MMGVAGSLEELETRIRDERVPACSLSESGVKTSSSPAVIRVGTAICPRRAERRMQAGVRLGEEGVLGHREFALEPTFHVEHPVALDVRAGTPDEQLQPTQVLGGGEQRAKVAKFLKGVGSHRARRCPARRQDERRHTLGMP